MSRRINASLRILALAMFALALGAVAPAAAQGGGARSVDGPKVVPADFSGDVRLLPAAPVGTVGQKFRLPRLKGPPVVKSGGGAPPASSSPAGGTRAPMPGTLQNFAGMSRTDPCAGGSCGGTTVPPDANGDVGPNHYIEAVNRAYAIYNKTGTLLVSFTEDQLWGYVPPPPPCPPTKTGCDAPQPPGPTYACAGGSQGDPIVLYDPIADRWILTHVAFASWSGPFYQCIAASKTSDPIAGGWWLYAMQMDTGVPGQPPAGALSDYPKFGVWHDCLYMGANEYTNFGTVYAGVSFASFNRADLYSGNPLNWSVGMLDYPANSVFSMFPANSVGHGPTAVQPGTPAWYVSESIDAYDFHVRKFTPGPNCTAGTLTAATLVPQEVYGGNAFGASVPQPNTINLLDNLAGNIMQKVQYRKIGAAESLWVVYTIPLATNQAALQWAQLDVTGGSIAPLAVQQQIYSPDSTLYRFMPSLAVDRLGNVAIGFSTSGASMPNFPSIKYVGRLAGDPPNTMPQAEVPLIAGLGSQTADCNSPSAGLCERWGDYSGMSIDPVDDCTFWYANQYYDSQANGDIGNWQTRIGSFKFPGCTAFVATVPRTFVASNGLDANPCSIAAPCRSFGAAIVKTSNGGEVVVLDSAGYGPVVINKPVSIVAPQGVFAGVSVFSGTGIVVNAALGEVTLRGLTINALGGATGIDFQSGDAVYLDHVVVNGFPSAGFNVLAAATGTVQIHDSIFRGNGIGATFGTTGGTSAVLSITVDNSSFDGNTTGVRFTGSSAVGEIRNSTLAGGTTGALLQPSIAGAVSRIDFVESTITKNATVGILAGGGTGTANVSVSSSIISGNGQGVNAAANGSVFVTASTITRNTTGLAGGGGTLTSGQFNRLYNNTTNGSFGSTVGRQ